MPMYITEQGIAINLEAVDMLRRVGVRGRMPGDSTRPGISFTLRSGKVVLEWFTDGGPIAVGPGGDCLPVRKARSLRDQAWDSLLWRITNARKPEV